jgi:ATP-dependent helicase/nuclease subunit B
MERELLRERPKAAWREFEKSFGSSDSPSWYDLPDGSRVRIRGRIDRIDDSGDGTITVIDYKTGKSGRYWTKRGEPAFKGGRQLQPAIYSEVVESSLGIQVDRFEYRFPTEKGQNDIVPYKKSDLVSARPVIAGLLEHVSTGAFLPTTDDGDCRFCDYKSICRVRESRFGVTSPLASWAKENQGNHSQFDSMRKRRGDDE